MKVYFISGLGADKRIFTKVELPENFEAIYIDWKVPVKDETLEDYALRLAEEINTREPFILVGLSMGGMIAIEIAKRFKPVATILLSSVPVKNELPGYYLLFGSLKLYKLVPPALFKSGSLIKRLFTTESKEDKKLISQIIRDTDPQFVKWAIGAILNWQNTEVPDHVWHIHGTKDEILPLKYTSATHTVLKGTHLMVLTRAKEMNEILKEILLKETNTDQQRTQ